MEAAVQHVSYGLAGDVSRSELSELIDLHHPLVSLSSTIPWHELEQVFKPIGQKIRNASSIPTRLMLGFHYLKREYCMSDEQAVLRWEHDPYWQYFCGSKYYERKSPLRPQELKRWREEVRGENLDF